MEERNQEDRRPQERRGDPGPPRRRRAGERPDRAQASVEAQKIVDEARKVAKEFADRSRPRPSARSADTLAKAQQSIELEHRKMLDQARGEIARLVVTTTERVLAKKLSDGDRAAYNEAATKELTVL
jgi:F-type H+-transporting ATPase subunit b